jgi:DNA-directed RNA polymerase subunit RPC12/RpoP
MSEFKYACPVCGQHIRCDSSQAGVVMTCPTCFQKIIVPNAPASGEQKFILAGIKVGNERPTPKILEPAPARSSTGLSGSMVVAIILAFICGVAATIYYETIFKHSSHAQVNPVSVAGQPQPLPRTNAPVEGVNLALEMRAYASSEMSNNPASNGNDGDATTYWNASVIVIPQWWVVDLSNIVTVTNIQIQWEHFSAHKYRIEASLDNTNWSLAVNRSANHTQLRTTSDDLDARTRFLRVVITRLAHNGSVPGFFEFRAFGSTNSNATSFTGTH